MLTNEQIEALASLNGESINWQDECVRLARENTDLRKRVSGELFAYARDQCDAVFGTRTYTIEVKVDAFGVGRYRIDVKGFYASLDWMPTMDAAIVDCARALAAEKQPLAKCEKSASQLENAADVVEAAASET